MRPWAASSCHLRPKPAARATQITVCRSRRPPGLSLQLGSSEYGVFSYFWWRWRISSVFARKNALGSIASPVARSNALNTLRAPHRKRDSRSAVCTVTSESAIATHSSTVRTLDPISRPASQQAVMKRSVAAPRASPSAGAADGSRTSTSTSEYGKSSPRP